MERMFERDKDDLRNLGITIEVGSFDPLFEDEVGYRIRPENYRAEIGSITPRELSLSPCNSSVARCSFGFIGIVCPRKVEIDWYRL
jgi:hypothetical protein